MKIKEILIKRKELKIPKKILFKSYLTGLFFSGLIILIPSLFIANLVVFYSLAILIHYLVAIDIIIFIFFILYFKDKALEVYVPEYKEVEHKKLLYLFITVVSIVVLLATFIILRSFRWW